MRLSFIQILIASLALHVSAGAIIATTYFHTAPASVTATSDAKSMTLYVLSSKETPDFRQATPASSKPAAMPLTVDRNVALPSPSQPAIEKEIISPAPQPTLTLEANPNAHLRALPPEEVLSPQHAPQLDGHNGVVFILDISGSMYEPCEGSTRLAFARQTLARRILALPDGTPFAITLYAESARSSGPLVAASDATRAAAVRFINEDVDCGGGTNLPAGLALATHLQAGNLVLVTDGDLNISQADLERQATILLGPLGHCPALSIVGIYPRPNTGDGQLLQSLAEQQGGTYHSEPVKDAELITMNRPEMTTR